MAATPATASSPTTTCPIRPSLRHRKPGSFTSPGSGSWRSPRSTRLLSADPVAGRHVVAVGAQEHHAVPVVEGPEHQHLGLEAGDAPRWEVHDGDHQSPVEILRGVVGDLRRGALLADLGPEVDAQLPGRGARLGEALDLDHATDAQVELLEVVEGGQTATARRAPAGPCPAPEESQNPSGKAVVARG